MRPSRALGLAVCLTVVTATAWGYWSVRSVEGGNGAAAASSLDQGATPTASAVSDDVTVAWDPTTLANGGDVGGYRLARYDAATLTEHPVLGDCAGTLTDTTCTENDVPDGTWTYAVTPVIGDNWVGAESATSPEVVADGTPPLNDVTLSAGSTSAARTGDTIYYRGVTDGSLRLVNTLTDALSGPASSTTALGGTATGWTHAGSTVSTPADGPYESDPFSWTAGTTSSPTVTVTGADRAGNLATTELSLVDDSTAPTAGTVTYADGFATGRSVSVSLTAGTDAGSGVGTRRLQRSSAALDDGACGTFGAFVDIGTDDPASPYTDTGLGSGCHRYRFVVTDRVGNQHVATSNSVAKIGYAGAVAATPGLLSHWRLGEASATLASYDSFTATSGSQLAGRAGDIGGGTWVHQTGSASAVIDSGRVRRNGLSGYTIDYLNAAPAGPDYSVEADLVVRSNLIGDAVGVIGRHNPATNTFYMARWEQADTSWNIVKYTNGTVSWLGYVANQGALTVGEAYRLRLEMAGTSLRLSVDGVEKVTATDATLTAAGRAGIMDGQNATSGAKTATTGFHLDNFQVTPAGYPRAADAKGTNVGDYKHGVTLGVPGAVTSSSNTAAQFDGVNDHVQVAPTSGFPTGASVRSTEMWFKTSSTARQVLFRYGSGGNSQEYGLWIDAGGATMTAWGWGAGNDKVFTLSSAVADGAWHHVVLTYDGAALTLYVDGAGLPSQAAARSTVMDRYGFGIGAVIRPSDGNSGGFFQGAIDEVSFYSSVLSPAQVADHHDLGVGPVADLSGPTGGSVDATGLVGTGSRYSTSTTLSLTLDPGSDPSGIASSGRQLRRATATLTDGGCGTFGSHTLVSGGSDPSSPYTDTVADQACYSYEYVVHDTMGNPTTYTSPNIKVDTTAPAPPSLAYAEFTNTWWAGSGSTVYYRSTASAGSFTATASSSDPASGIASYAFPALGSGWTGTDGALGTHTYSWSGTPGATGNPTVTATNNAGLASTGTPVTLTADDTAPSAGTVTYADATQTSTSVSVAFTTGTDDGSGLGTRLLQRASAPLTGSTCGSFGSFATVVGGTDPTSPFTDTAPGGSCHRYRYVVADHVGNTHTATSSNVVKVQASCGSQLLGNGGFENGADATPWVESPADVVTNTGTVPARTGSWKARLGGQGTDATETVSQQVTIPAGCSATLTYWLRVTTSETSHPWDFFRVQVGGTVLQTYSDADLGASYVQRTVDLSAYAGQTITLTFLSDEDGSVATNFWLDDVELTTAAAPTQTYAETVNGTAGLLSHYRLGESTISSDAMTGSAGVTLQSRSGATGATWTKHGLSDADAVLTDAGRLRKNGNQTWNALYSASGVPTSADYTVETDVHVASNLANDMAGVVGRMDPSAANGTYYLARYEQASQNWALYRRLNGSWDWLGAWSQALGAGTTHRLALDMTGTSIRVLVNGVERIAVTDGAISGPGRGGISLGFAPASTTVTNTTGLHLDNFRISPPLADSKGTNHGDYLGGVQTGAAGAIAGDSSTAATFDGVDDFGSVTRQIADDFSIELWFKSTQGIGTGTQWWSGAGLVDGEVAGSFPDFGVSLRADGRVVAGVGGGGDVSIVSSVGGLGDGAWHHVVFTRVRSTGALALYVDGVAAGSATGSTVSLTAPAALTFGRLQSGTNHFAGSLDEVALYNTALAPSTIAAHHAAAQ